ncbi:MAG TPA: hypothetical protein PKV71_10350 [Calditrichia bacterium]|nr:hypothetical protein [Calditrichota bacterium]HQU73463.1 hypothetical protein [Calditrichia bacterium]HQV32268.1 hypothetical protein [Calditrichia bacterium]
MKQLSKEMNSRAVRKLDRFAIRITMLLAVLTGIALQSCGTAPPDEILKKAGQGAIVFVRENSVESNGNNAMKGNPNEYHPGTDLMLLSPVSATGELTNLTEQYTREGQDQERNYGHACDPEVSLDGKKIIFAMKKNRNARWHIYEMNIDGTDLEQLTDQTEGDDMDPLYLPNGQVMFLSTRPGIVDEYERRPSPLVHVADRLPDGRLTNIHQVDFNQSHDANPMVHSSGKIFYSRWEHLGNPNKFSIFVMNPDGTRTFILYGNHSPRQSGSRVFLEPRELADGGLVCSVMERNSPFEGGAIGIIDISSSDDNITFISPTTSPFNNTNQESRAVFKSPHPIFDNTADANNREKIMFSMSPHPVNDPDTEERVDYGLYVMDKNGDNLRLIHNDPAYNEVDAVPVAPREELPGGLPKVIPTDPNVVAGRANGATTGMFFDGNVYDRATNDGQMRPDPNHVNVDGTLGQAKHLRILEAVGMPISGNRRGGPMGNTNLEKQRIVGYAPIRDDGSFSVEVPAERSLHMQTLDENGMMLVNQITWVHVMPGEKRLCTGCHDSHARDKIIGDLEIQTDFSVMNKSENRQYNSGFNNAVDVSQHVAARTDTVDFFDKSNPGRTNTVQAVFDNKCVSCHGLSNPSGGLRLANNSSDLQNEDEETSVYDFLTTDNNYRTVDGDQIDYVTERGARRSPLLWAMFHRQLDGESGDYRIGSYDHSQLWVKNNGHIDVWNPANRGLLMMIEWADMGNQYSNSTD